MRMLLDENGAKRVVNNLSIPQAKQAASIMDCIGRLIPHEGVDYNVDIIFKGVNNPAVSINITPMTDKGEWWRKYVMEMIKKYPPLVDYRADTLPDKEDDGSSSGSNEGDTSKEEVSDAKVVS